MFNTMKISFVLVILFAWMVAQSEFFAQGLVMSERTKADLRLVERYAPAILRGDDEVAQRFPILKIDQTYYVSFIGKLVETPLDVPQGVRIGKGVGKIRSVRVDLTMLDDLHLLSGIVESMELATKIAPNLSRVRFDTHTDSAYLGIDLPQGYTGKNVLIGVQDWGFDYTHPMFYDTLLQHTRIVAAWDHFKTSGPHPIDFSYGTEYIGAESIIAAKGDTSNQLRYATHATHVVGIAGGSGAQKIAMGMAPEVHFLFSTVRVDEAAALDSWEWMYQKAQEQQKNLVVNMSWGLYHYGTNDGTSLLSQAISEYTEKGVLFVTSAGNNGNDKFHFQKDFDNDSVFSRVKFYDYSVHDSMWGQSIHAWGEVGKDFEVKFQIRHVNGAILNQTDYFSTINNGYTDSFLVVNANDRVVQYHS